MSSFYEVGAFRLTGHPSRRVATGILGILTVVRCGSSDKVWTELHLFLLYVLTVCLTEGSDS